MSASSRSRTVQLPSTRRDARDGDGHGGATQSALSRRHRRRCVGRVRHDRTAACIALTRWAAARTRDRRRSRDNRLRHVRSAKVCVSSYLADARKRRSVQRRCWPQAARRSQARIMVILRATMMPRLPLRFAPAERTCCSSVSAHQSKSCGLRKIWLRLDAMSASASVGRSTSLPVTVQRAPEFWQKLGLEWFYRLVREPWRWRRQLALPAFLNTRADGRTAQLCDYRGVRRTG